MTSILLKSVNIIAMFDLLQAKKLSILKKIDIYIKIYNIVSLYMLNWVGFLYIIMSKTKSTTTYLQSFKY